VDQAPPTVEPSPTSSSRQTRADDTRARLFAAAVKMFATRGYHETTVDQIAREAGVAKGTFFVHFAAKGAVVIELVRVQTRVALKARDRAAGPVGRLRASVMSLGEQAGASRGLSRAVLAAGLENPEVGATNDALFGEVFARMIEDAREGQRTRVLVARPDAETIASALMASYLGAALHFTTSPGARPLVDVLGPLVEANLRGFVRASKKRNRT
jgi:AcrR family transcriptional regulator